MCFHLAHLKNIRKVTLPQIPEDLCSASILRFSYQIWGRHLSSSLISRNICTWHSIDCQSFILLSSSSCKWVAGYLLRELSSHQVTQHQQQQKNDRKTDSISGNYKQNLAWSTFSSFPSKSAWSQQAETIITFNKVLQYLSNLYVPYPL